MLTASQSSIQSRAMEPIATKSFGSTNDDESYNPTSIITADELDDIELMSGKKSRKRKREESQSFESFSVEGILYDCNVVGQDRKIRPLQPLETVHDFYARDIQTQREALIKVFLENLTFALDKSFQGLVDEKKEHLENKRNLYRSISHETNKEVSAFVFEHGINAPVHAIDDEFDCGTISPITYRNGCIEVSTTFCELSDWQRNACLLTMKEHIKKHDIDYFLVMLDLLKQEKSVLHKKRLEAAMKAFQIFCVRRAEIEAILELKADQENMRKDSIFGLCSADSKKFHIQWNLLLSIYEIQPHNDHIKELKSVLKRNSQPQKNFELRQWLLGQSVSDLSIEDDASYLSDTQENSLIDAKQFKKKN